MKLDYLRLYNFQSFGPEVTKLSFEDTTYIIGPNGSGKTAVLQALCRMFGVNQVLRRVKSTDFYVGINETAQDKQRELWIEAIFSFPETRSEADNSTVAPHFRHMRLKEVDGVPTVTYRLSATMDPDGDIEERFEYVLEVDSQNNDEPLKTVKVPLAERKTIEVHYLPSSRDPSEHITYGANALLGRLLRAVVWTEEKATIETKTNEISDVLSTNRSIEEIDSSICNLWGKLHRGDFFKNPKITFFASEIDSLLKKPFTFIFSGA